MSLSLPLLDEVELAQRRDTIFANGLSAERMRYYVTVDRRETGRTLRASCEISAGLHSKLSSTAGGAFNVRSAQGPSIFDLLNKVVRGEASPEEAFKLARMDAELMEYAARIVIAMSEFPPETCAQLSISLVVEREAVRLARAPFDFELKKRWGKGTVEKGDVLVSGEGGEICAIPTGSGRLASCIFVGLRGNAQADLSRIPFAACLEFNVLRVVSVLRPHFRQSGPKTYDR